MLSVSLGQCNNLFYRNPFNWSVCKSRKLFIPWILKTKVLPCVLQCYKSEIENSCSVIAIPSQTKTGLLNNERYWYKQSGN